MCKATIKGLIGGMSVKRREYVEVDREGGKILVQQRVRARIAKEAHNN